MSWVVCPSRTAFQAVVIQEIAVKPLVDRSSPSVNNYIIKRGDICPQGRSPGCLPFFIPWCSSGAIERNVIGVTSSSINSAASACMKGSRWPYKSRVVNALAKAGFTKVHNIIDGFEGDKVEDPESIYHGMRMRNGRKNSVPWTYLLDPKLLWLPSDVELETLRTTLEL